MKNTRQLYKYLFIIFLSSVFLQSCKTLETQKKANSMNSAMQLYRESIRWAEWPTVLSLYKPEPGNTDISPPQSHDLNMLKTIRITDVQKAGVNLNEEQTRAQTSIFIEYHLDNSNSIKSINHPMNWWYNGEFKTWYTSTPLPDFLNNAE